MLVPVKAFADAKQRLRPVLADSERAALARWCAERVLEAAGAHAVHVVCDDPDVAEWAASRGAAVVHSRETGLNPAVEQGLTVLRDAGIDIAVVAHGDLPLAHSFDSLIIRDVVTVVPDFRYDGTNALVLPTALAGRFTFHYGRGSFRRHVAEAIQQKQAVRVLRDRDLALDLDTPADLNDPRLEEVRQWLQTNRDNPR